MDTESGTNVVSLIKREEGTLSETFMAAYLAELRKTPKDAHPTNIFLIEYFETPDQSSYQMRIGGPGQMRPHSLVGILECVKHTVIAST